MAVSPVKPKSSTPPSHSTAGLTAAAKKAFAKVDWQSGAFDKYRLDRAETNPERMKLVAKLPKAVQEAFHFYFNNVEQADWGSVGVYKTTVNGQAVFAVHTSTDGDDGYLELFNYAGKRIATGLTGFADDGKGGFVPTTTWDKKLGDVRKNIQ